jgi:hypothetical protein
MEITRRKIIIGAPAVALLAWSNPQAAHAEQVHLSTAGTLSPVTSAPFVSYSTDFRLEYRLDYPLYVTLQRPDPDPVEPVQVSVLYDGRLFDPSNSVVCSGPGNDFVSQEISAPQTTSDGRMALTFLIDGGRTDRAFVMPLVPKDLYPSENLGEVKPIDVSAGPSGAAASEVASMQIIARELDTGVLPWGIELRAGWNAIEAPLAGPGDLYRLPVIVHCQSVGPGRTSDQLQLEVVGDARLVTSVRVESAMVNGVAATSVLGTPSTESDGGRLRARFPLAALEAGDALTVELAFSPAAGVSTMRNVVFASVNLITPPEIVGQRATGLTMATDRSASGIPNEQDSAVGTI